MIILIFYAMHFYLNIISPFDCSKSGGVGPPHFEKWGGPDPPDPPGGYARGPMGGSFRDLYLLNKYIVSKLWTQRPFSAVSFSLVLYFTIFGTQNQG